MTKVAACDRRLAASVAHPLSCLGIRTFPHAGGKDAADVALLDRMSTELPPSCNLVVIGSGDHIFDSMADRLRAAGRRVEVLAQAGTVSASLYQAADAFTDLGRFVLRRAA